MRNENAFQTMQEDAASLWCPSVDRIEDPSSQFEDYFHRNCPVILPFQYHPESADTTTTLSDSLKSTFALHCNDEKLLSLSVNVTPDGRGDCIRQVEGIGDCFVEPLERQITLKELLLKTDSSRSESVNEDMNPRERLFPQYKRNEPSERQVPAGFQNNDDKSVYYYSKQNDCLRNEAASLQSLFPSSFAWAERIFGSPPDAVNIWIGNEGSRSSLHKDYYENLFVVLEGEKIFTVLPPCYVSVLPEKPYPSGKFVYENETWGVHVNESESSSVRWIDVDLQDIDIVQHPLLKFAKPLEIRVKPGEMLYLPSLWYHQVEQVGRTVAVNYWYDMKFDTPQWTYFHFLQELKNTQWL